MKIRYLVGISSLLLIFWATIGNSAKIVVPTDVLSEEEIEEITTNQDFFFRNDHLDHDGPIWPHLDRKYGHHLFTERTENYSLQNVIHRSLSDGFPVHYMMQQLWRGELAVHTAIGGILPKLSVKFGEGQYAINEGSLFTNLFQFLLPQQWFSLAQAGFVYDATKYLALKTILDQYYAAELSYLNLHQLIQDFEIRNFYLIHMELLNDYLGDSQQNTSTLAGTYAQLGTDMASNRGAIKLAFDDLAEVMALRVDRGGKLAADHLNIDSLHDFPLRVADLSELAKFYNNKEDFIHEMLNKSVELKAIKEFFTAAKLGIGVTAFGSILSTVANPADNDYVTLSVNVGYDTLPKMLTSVSLTKTAEIDVESTFVQMVEMGRRAFDTYTNSLGGFTEATRSMELNRKAIAEHLSDILDRGQPVSAMFLRDFSNLIDSELKLNNALHGALRAHAWMRRLLVTEEKYLTSFLPDEPGARKIRRFFMARYDGGNGESHMDKVLKHVNTTKHLTAFLRGSYQHGTFRNLDGNRDDLDKDDIPELVSNHMPTLLHRVVPFTGKYRKFYRVLNKYVEENKVDISYEEKQKLRKRAGLRVERVEFGQPHHRILNCLTGCSGIGRKY